MSAKDHLRTLLNFLHLDLTKNLEYDRLTKAIMKEVIRPGFNCIDVGCHKGEILDYMLQYSPDGKHYGFEPIPYLYDHLKTKYKGKAKILPYALSDKTGTTTFQLVKNAPAYSGINKRKYDIKDPEIEEIQVELRTLDEIIPKDLKIGFIKIDVEGGEFDVLKGGKDLIKRNQPFVIFEFGLGASDYYGTKPVELYHFLTGSGLKISTLKSFIKRKPSLTAHEFEFLYNTNKEYYFLAWA